MARYGRSLLVAAFIAAVFGVAWLQNDAQRARADDSATAARAIAQTLDAVLEMETATRDFTVTRDRVFLDGYTVGRRRLDGATRVVRSSVADGGALRAQLDRQTRLIATWAASAGRDISATQTGTATPQTAATWATARDPLLQQVRVANDSLGRALDVHRREARDAAATRGIVLIATVCALFALLHWVLFSRVEQRETRSRSRQLRFAEALRTARSEDEARALLSHHLEEVAPGAMVTVTGETGEARESAARRPIVTGGVRVGTVIVRTSRDLRPRTERAVHDSILRAAPVLANLRALAIAELRAATDPLTGLGNRRLVEDALNRMVAQSRRTGDGLAVVMIDVDRFKSVNDTFGHEAGDALLVEIARVLSNATREYDIVGRRGGDEFIMLLAQVDDLQASNIVGRCRRAIADLHLGQPPVTATASFGIATSGGAIGDPAALLRAADDALYTAKARGGNTVVTSAQVVV
jgi:diguanylate cyclase (GGDEF)-like protein